MLHSELITAMELQQKMTIILFDNSGFQCIQNLQCSNGSNSFKTQLTVLIDFQKYAQALGVTTYQANNAHQLSEALKSARLEKNSVLIELKVDPRSMSNGYDSWWRVATEENENERGDS
jgi:3D-(3,5/4)-trihydroxycyclohexane-1,2-dione acylhydrolase (decyclizing)